MFHNYQMFFYLNVFRILIYLTNSERHLYQHYSTIINIMSILTPFRLNYFIFVHLILFLYKFETKKHFTYRNKII